MKSVLAGGGAGCVYAAIDQTTEKRVAVKILSNMVGQDRSAREKFTLEARVGGRVESEHIVEVWDAGIDPNTQLPYLVMELLKGQDLQKLVEGSGPLATELALLCLRQIASALDKAHGWRDADGRLTPIVHRDLKPQNLFLTHREDGTPWVKILDFGLAKVLASSATLSTELRGTPLYMAPEQLSQGRITPATDVWALGLVAFYLLAGTCYWKTGQKADSTWPAVLKEVSEGTVEPPRARLRELGKELELPIAFDAWFLRCTATDPKQRFGSAGEAIQALKEAMEPPRAAPARREGGSRPLLLIGLLLGLVLLVVLGLTARPKPKPRVSQPAARTTAKAQPAPTQSSPVVPEEPVLVPSSTQPAEMSRPIKNPPRRVAPAPVAAPILDAGTLQPVPNDWRRRGDPADHR